MDRIIPELVMAIVFGTGSNPRIVVSSGRMITVSIGGFKLIFQVEAVLLVRSDVE
jgi:hypothetical protein